MIIIPKRAGTWSATVTFLDALGAERDVSAGELSAYLTSERGVVVRTLDAEPGATVGAVDVADLNGTSSWPLDTDLRLHVEAVVGGVRYTSFPPTPLRVVGASSGSTLVEIADAYNGYGRSTRREESSVWRGTSGGAAPSGGARQLVTVTTSSATLPDADALVIVNALFTAVTLTVPTNTAGNSTRRYDIVEVTSSGITIARAAGVNINGVDANYSLPGFVGTYRMQSLSCDGTGWWTFQEGTA